MAPSQSPFRHQLPSFSASALEFAFALVSGKDISHVLIDALPVDSLVRKKGYTDDLRRLAKKEWFSTGLINLFMHLLPTSHDSCVVLPVNYLVGESGSAPACVMFGIGLVHNDSLGVDLLDDHGDPHNNYTYKVPLARVRAVLSQHLHSLMGERYDPDRMQLSVSSRDHVVCMCFDRVNHYRLFVVAVHANLAQLCVWDPLDLEARNPSDYQAALALSVMQKLLPAHKVEVVRPTSMCVLNASQVFATAQTDGYQCGPIAVRALVHLLFQTDFALGERALNNVRIWMAACIAEGKLCM